jgi:DedD protein
MDEHLKERIVGAAVLVVVAVIVIPMVLSGPEEEPVAETAPPVRDEFASRVLPLKTDRTLSTAREDDTVARSDPSLRDGDGDAPPPADAPPPSADSPASAKAPAPAAAKAPRKAVAPPPAKVPVRPPAAKPEKATQPAAPAPKPKPKLKLSASTAPGPRRGWVVQLGSFSNKRNAHGLRDRLLEKGYRAFTQTSTSAGVTVTRVYVGPMPSRDRARASLPALLEETRLKGIVTRYDG